MLARILAIGVASIFVAATAPTAWSSDTGGIKGKTAVTSTAKVPALHKGGVNTPRENVTFTYGQIKQKYTPQRTNNPYIRKGN
jgi:hypothetical protein